MNANLKFDFLNSMDIDQDVKSKLSINLMNIVKGNSEVFVTPMGKDNRAEIILQKWSKVIESNKSRLNKVLYNLEISQSEKTGPRSISTPWDIRKEGLSAYFEDDKLNYDDITAPLPKGNLRPISLHNAIKMLKNDTNSGLPYYKRKGLIKDRVLQEFDELLKREDPCVLFTRTQEQGKTRDVWGYPMADTLNEMTYYVPLLEYQKRLHWRAALLGPDAVSEAITRIIEPAIRDGLTLISIDFSGYDRSLKQGLQLKVGEYYKSLFQNKYSDDIDKMIRRKSTIGIVTPDGIISGPHGEPSGSTLTNEDDSIAQYMIAKSSGVFENSELFNMQGDDGVYALKDDKIVSLYSSFKRHGLIVNESKSYESNDYLIYLQNLYHNDYKVDGVIKGIYPTFRALNRILYQERWSNFEDYGIKGSDYYSIRTISILENCKHHPLFEEFVKFVVENDKYGLRPSQEGISQYVKMLTNMSGSEGILVNQYGDNIKGIKSFETFKLISRL